VDGLHGDLKTKDSTVVKLRKIITSIRNMLKTDNLNDPIPKTRLDAIKEMSLDTHDVPKIKIHHEGNQTDPIEPIVKIVEKIIYKAKNNIEDKQNKYDSPKVAAPPKNVNKVKNLTVI
jgi:hypothetical protein